VKQKLRDRFSEGVHLAAYKHVTSKLDLAGHPVPASTIQGEQASVFEFRAVPAALGDYLYSSKGREWELPREQREAENTRAAALLGARSTGRPSQLDHFVEKARQLGSATLTSEHKESSEWD